MATNLEMLLLLFFIVIVIVIVIVIKFMSAKPESKLASKSRKYFFEKSEIYSYSQFFDFL